MTNVYHRAEAIKDALRACKSLVELQQAWLADQGAISDMRATDNVMYIQIVNLKDQRKDDFLREITNQGAG